MIPGQDSDAGAPPTDAATGFEPKSTESGAEHKRLNESDDGDGNAGYISPLR